MHLCYSYGYHFANLAGPGEISASVARLFAIRASRTPLFGRYNTVLHQRNGATTPYYDDIDQNTGPREDHAAAKRSTQGPHRAQPQQPEPEQPALKKTRSLTPLLHNKRSKHRAHKLVEQQRVNRSPGTTKTKSGHPSCSGRSSGLPKESASPETSGGLPSIPACTTSAGETHPRTLR